MVSVASLLLLTAIIQALMPQPPSPRTPEPAAPAPFLVLILTTPGAERTYHDPGCDLVKSGRDVQALTRGRAEVDGYKAHLCVDAVTIAPVAPLPPPPRPKAPANDKMVWVAGESNKYHLAGCKALGSNAKRLTLDRAGRQYWPCARCKPPIRERSAKGIELMNWKKKQ